MSVKTTTCPRCDSRSVVHLPESIGCNQWRCNQCSHQWDFASPEERALVPNHLTGSRAEQFLEEFLAIKALIKAEAEQIWNGCSNVHQMISVAANDEKPRVFSEQFDRWRDQLIGLQEMLIVDRLLPLVVKYQILANEQIWLLQACHEAWSPVTAGYLDWLTFAVRGHLHGVGTAAIPEWAWQLRGAPRGVVRLELSPEKKASAHFRCLADTLQRELVVYRKGAIAKAFLARKTNESRIVDNGRERLETDADHRPLVSVNPDSVAELAPGALNAQPLRFANGNSKLPAQPVKADSDAWIRRADELLAKHPSANYHRASELYQFATSMLSTLYGVESPEMQSLRSNAESASKDKSAFQAGHISLLAQGAIKAARDDLKTGLTGSLKSAPEIVPISTIKGAVTGALLSRYRSEIKRAILTQLALNPKATDGEICRGLDADGSVELPSRWKSKVSDRGFFDAYSDTVRRHKVEVTISKVRKDLRRQGLLD